MPICLNPGSSSHELLKSTKADRGQSRVEFRESSARCLDIGLLNNMPDGALHSTERQFCTLLGAAAGGTVVRLSLYALQEVPRSDSGRRHIGRFYSGVEELRNRHLDGLIVTGAEPIAANLRDEPYWGSMTSVFDWAEQNTHSTVCSCLAAHAAVLHMDGIPRRRLGDKCFGLFECATVSHHQLTAGIPEPPVMPHSRWNDLPEKALLDSGYRILMRSKEAGVDTFVKQNKSLLIFFQGHPEYEANTLMLEYRRDVGRYLRHERETYPLMPKSYFDQDAVDALTAAQDRAIRDRREEALADFPTTLAARNLDAVWCSAAVGIYENWLAYLCAQKERRLQKSTGRRAFATAREVSLSRRSAAAR